MQASLVPSSSVTAASAAEAAAAEASEAAAGSDFVSCAATVTLARSVARCALQRARSPSASSPHVHHRYLQMYEEAEEEEVEEEEVVAIY